MPAPIDQATEETAPVTVTLLSCDSVVGLGRIEALAAVEISIAGIAFELRGIRIIRSRNGDTLSIGSPVFRGRNGQWVDTIVLPPELRRPLGELVGAAFAELGCDLGLALPPNAMTE